MSAPILRIFLPQGYKFPYVQLSRSVRPPRISYRTPPICQNASTRASKPRVLEKPTRFNPPSHGKRLKERTPRQYGPQLTEEQKVEQQTKKYPHMMPAEGTFMYWFLTSRGIHTFISMGTLVLLASITAYENWRLATAFREQLPTVSELLSRPLSAFSQAWEVYKLEVAKTSAETAQMRDRDTEDVQKRNTYRIAHGLMEPDAQGLGPWKGSNDDERIKVGRALRRPVGVEPGQELEVETAVESGDKKVESYKDYEGKRRPIKKWLGIW